MNQAWWLAAGAALGTVWGQLRELISRVTSVLVVRVSVNSELNHYISIYLFKHAKAPPINSKTFFSSSYFIRPVDKYGQVVFESCHGQTFYFLGKTPIWLAALSNSSNGDHQDTASFGTISYIRGTINFDELSQKAVDYHNNLQWQADKSEILARRFRVNRMYGRHVSRSDDKTVAESKGPRHNTGVNTTFYQTNRFLKWEANELGTKTSETPFSSLAYGPSVQVFKDTLVKWKSAEKWFKERYLSHRLGCLCMGPPGNGKTSFIRAIAQELDMPIYLFDLASMSNEEFVDHWQTVLENTPAIVLFEDMDRMFNDKREFLATQSLLREKPPLTLDCILNCASGVESSDGILLFVTANDVSKLDPALGVPNKDGTSTRPGRLDFAIEFGPPDEIARIQIANRILLDFDARMKEFIVLQGSRDSGAQFVKRCQDEALKYYRENLL